MLAWTGDIEGQALQQLRNVAQLPFVFHHVAAMPDVHAGIGATVGSVIATHQAIIPAAVGVDIGCGMNAVRLSLDAKQLPEDLSRIRSAIEAAVPVGFDRHSAKSALRSACKPLAHRLADIIERHPEIAKMQRDHRETWVEQMGTLGGGNHFIELCLDEADRLWVMLHSGSRGIGNCIGRHFIAEAREQILRSHVHLPDKDLAYLQEGSRLFGDYVDAVSFAQDYAWANRHEMIELILEVLHRHLPAFEVTGEAINCHHNYVGRENHFGQNVLVTRKGAVRAATGVMGIIPGSMGAKSFIVRGLGNKESFDSCSHGAGRVMSRTQAKREVTVAEHVAATEGVACRKDEGVIDESPRAYKPIEAVMAAQADLVEIVHTLKQVVCVKG